MSDKEEKKKDAPELKKKASIMDGIWDINNTFEYKIPFHRNPLTADDIRKAHGIIIDEEKKPEKKLEEKDGPSLYKQIAIKGRRVGGGIKEKLAESVEKPKKAPVKKKPSGKRQVPMFYIGEEKERHVSWMVDVEFVDNMEKAEVVILGPGPYINPGIYGGVVSQALAFEFDDDRDISDIKAFMRARKLGKRIIGIARGAHLCCSMAGGTVCQYYEQPRLFRCMAHDGSRYDINFNRNDNCMLQYPNRDFHFYNILSSMTQSAIHYTSAGQERQLNTGEIIIAHYADVNALAIDGSVWNGSELYQKFVNQTVEEFVKGHYDRDGRWDAGNNDPLEHDRPNVDGEFWETDEGQAILREEQEERDDLEKSALDRAEAAMGIRNQPQATPQIVEYGTAGYVGFNPHTIEWANFDPYKGDDITKDPEI